MSSERFRSWTLPYAIDQFILLEAHLAESEDLHQTQTRYGIENMKALQDKLTASETARDTNHEIIKEQNKSAALVEVLERRIHHTRMRDAHCRRSP